MPLLKKSSKKAFTQNVKTEMKAHPEPERRAQNLAIAYSLQRHAKAQHKAHGGECTCEKCLEMAKMAEGGQISDNYESFGHSKLTHPDLADHEQESGFVSHADDQAILDEAARIEDRRALGQHGALEQGPDHMAEGGQIVDNEQSEAHERDMVGRIMAQRQQHFSQGGKVANEDHGKDDEDLAGFDQNEFDDLSLRDDLEFSETGANSGDELSDAQEDKDRHDMVARIMKSRRLKDKLPKPA